MSNASKFLMARLLEGGSKNVPDPKSLRIEVEHVQDDWVTFRVIITDGLDRELAEIMHATVMEGSTVTMTHIERAFMFTLKSSS